MDRGGEVMYTAGFRNRLNSGVQLSRTNCFDILDRIDELECKLAERDAAIAARFAPTKQTHQIAIIEESVDRNIRLRDFARANGIIADGSQV